MSTDKNQDGSIDENNGGEEQGAEEGKITLSKEEYDSLKKHEATVGSLKRELKDLKKSFEETSKPPTETPKNQTPEFGLLQLGYLRTAGIIADDEVELAKETQKKWGMEWNKLVDDEDFKVKLQRLRDAKANADATNIKGGAGAQTSNAKTTPEYWSQKGTLPTPDEVPDRKIRAKIINEMVSKERGRSGGYYNS